MLSVRRVKLNICISENVGCCISIKMKPVRERKANNGVTIAQTYTKNNTTQYL